MQKPDSQSVRGLRNVSLLYADDEVLFESQHLPYKRLILCVVKEALIAPKAFCLVAYYKTYHVRVLLLFCPEPAAKPQVRYFNNCYQSCITSFIKVVGFGVDMGSEECHPVISMPIILTCKSLSSLPPKVILKPLTFKSIICHISRWMPKFTVTFQAAYKYIQ